MGRYKWDKTNHVLVPITGGQSGTDATQGMIATLEADSTSCSRAYSVGDYLITANTLYEVIAAIAVGDALVAYETDPSNANVRLAPNIEVQLADRYSIGDTASSTINDTDYIPMSESGGTKKKTLWTTLVDKIKTTILSCAEMLGLMDNVKYNGAYNLLKVLATTQTVSGVTFTVNTDGTISLSGTASSDIEFYISPTYSQMGLQSGVSYKLSGCPSGGSGSTYCIGGLFTEWSSIFEFEFGNGATFTPSNDTADDRFLICIKSGVNVNELVFKPMITLASQPDSDYEHFVPFTGYPNSALLPLTGGTVANTLVLSNTTDASGTSNTNCALKIGNITGQHLEFDTNEIMSKADNTTPGPLYLNNDGGTVCINGKVAARHTATPTSGQIMIADGTTGGIKTSGYTIAKSVPSTAVFTDTTYTAGTGIVISSARAISNSGVRSIATGTSNGTISVNTNGTSANVAVKGLGSNAYTSTAYMPISGGTFTGGIAVSGSTIKVSGSITTLNGFNAGNDTTIINGVTYTNVAGNINIFNSSGYAAILKAGSNTSNINLILPTSKGTIALTSSSRRVKKNIRDMTEEDAKKILDIDIIKFDYKEFWDDRKNQSGLIAEDVQKIIPEAVFVRSDYDPNQPVDDEYNFPPEVDYQKFVPYLIKMVQLQQAKIEELEARINS